MLILYILTHAHIVAITTLRYQVFIKSFTDAHAIDHMAHKNSYLQRFPDRKRACNMDIDKIFIECNELCY